MRKEEATRFRGMVARANYLAQDRIDLQFSAKEICRFMSSPTETSKEALRWLGRFLLGHKRVVYNYPFQRANCIEVYSDTDWAGVSVALAQHNTPSSHQRRGSNTELIGAKQSTDNNVATSSKTTVNLHCDTASELIAH